MFGAQAGADFRSQLEKVADTVLRFEPTATEAANVGIDTSTTFHEWLTADCIALGIVNIRVIKRIERFSQRLERDLQAFDRRVLKQAIHSAALFIYAKFQPDTAPSLEFIKSFNSYERVPVKEGSQDPVRTGWLALIEQFGFTHVDEFDAVILGGVERGSLDATALNVVAEKLGRKFKLYDQDQSFSRAWKAYHDSFDDNLKSILDAMEEAIPKCAPAITPANLSGTISFLKEMGQGQNSKRLIQQYIAARADDELEFWDLNEYLFEGDVKDQDVIAAFKAKFQMAVTKPDPAELLVEIGKRRSWYPQDVGFLSGLSADDFYKIFKSRRGDDLRRAIYTALMFRDGANASEKAISKAAEDALRTIGKESSINARRVARYGIRVDDEPQS